MLQKHERMIHKQMIQKHHERIFEHENLIFSEQQWVGKGKVMGGGGLGF